MWREITLNIANNKLNVAIFVSITEVSQVRDFSSSRSGWVLP